MSAVEDLRGIYPHSITPPFESWPLEFVRRFACFGFALRLYKWPGYLALRDPQRILPTVDSLEFVQAVLDESVEKTPSAAADRNLVIYSSEAGIVHAGLVCGTDRVLSKWGTNYVWHHPTFEAPLEYGDTVRYFVTPPFERIIELYVHDDERQIQAAVDRFEQSRRAWRNSK